MAGRDLPERSPVRSTPSPATAVGGTRAGSAGRAALGRADSGDAVPDVADVVLASLGAQAMSRCLARLPEPQRVCIVLMDVAGYTARETAEAVGCPRGTVLARVHRGRRRLAQLLAEAGVSHGRP